MRIKIHNQIAAEIEDLAPGAVFSAKDLLHFGKRDAVDKALSRLCAAGAIRRIARGLYDKPRHSAKLNATLSPDIGEAAKAIARKFKWQIYPTGNQVLNQLGLSTQVQARHVYLTAGTVRKRLYKISGASIEFKRVPPQQISFRHPESAMLVSSVKALGPDGVQNETALVLRKLIGRKDEELMSDILQDTQTVPAWVHEGIHRVAEAE